MAFPVREAGKRERRDNHEAYFQRRYCHPAGQGKQGAHRRASHRGMGADRLRIPLRQSPGPALLPAVQPGDKVKIGQRVGHPAGDSGVPVHCGVSGTVTAVEEGSGPFGPGPVVFIENDHQRAEAPLLPAAEGRQGLRMLMREAGLIGMGGAGFPTYRKYDTDRGIRTLLINGGECEPYLTCDDRLMVFEARKVVTGALAMARAVAAPAAEPLSSFLRGKGQGPGGHPASGGAAGRSRSVPRPGDRAASPLPPGR